MTPSYEGCAWAADFTHLDHRGKDICVATVIDLFTRKIVGIAVSTKHDARLVIEAFGNAILAHGRPAIFHSDNGSEYHAKSFRQILSNLGVSISRSQKGCPWENGYQESFYGKFKTDLGEPNRFASLGELTAAVYETIHCYNTERIHSAFRMPPAQFALAHAAATITSIHLESGVEKRDSLQVAIVVIKWIICIGAVGVIIRTVTLLSEFRVYLTNDPWDWLALVLILSPAVPLVLFIFLGKAQKSVLGQVSPAK